MTRISISIEKRNDNVFEVTVADSKTTSHTVTVTDKDLYNLTGDSITKIQFLGFSLDFLLQREPNTSILSSFDIKVISKYFSNYGDEVRKWCDESQS